MPDDLKNAADDRFLTGQLLLAMPSLREPPFHQAVILVCAHTADGAMGIVVNRPLTGASFPDLLTQLGVEPVPPGRNMRLHDGGPVEGQRGFVLHTSDWTGDGTIRVDERLAVTASLDVLRTIAGGGGPRQVMLALGHAGWGGGQLEREITENSWLTLPATDLEVIFGDQDAAKWRRAMGALRIDPGLLVDVAGHA